MNVPQIESLRIDLRSDADFTAKGWSRRVTALDGVYSRARACEPRFVTLPATPEGLTLAAELIAVFGAQSGAFSKPGRTTIVLRCKADHDWNSFTNRSAEVVNYVIDPKSEPWVAAVRLARVLDLFQERAAKWWQSEGKTQKETRDRSKRAEHADLLKRYPAIIAEQVQRAIDAGVDRDVLRAAIDKVIDGAAL